MAKQLSPSRQTAIKTVHAALTILKNAGGSMLGSEVIKTMRDNLSFTDWERERYEKTGYIRWESILHFFSVDCTKAGFLRKEKGVWHLTPEGEEALKKYTPQELFETANRLYRKWDAENRSNKSAESSDATDTVDEALEDPVEQKNIKASLDAIKDEALKNIIEFINRKTPYEFQDMVAALLRAMGYHIPYIAKKGKDGGLDVIAYSDPLGATLPRLKVQIKHKPDNPIAVSTVRELIGTLKQTGDIGLFVTSGSYTRDSESTARNSTFHIELIDISRFIDLWVTHYQKMPDEDKYLLPLQSVHHLAPID